MHSVDANMKKNLVKQKYKEFLAFSSPEVRLLIDSIAVATKSLTNIAEVSHL